MPGSYQTTGVVSGGYLKATTTYQPGPTMVYGSHDQNFGIRMFHEGEPGASDAISARGALGDKWQELVKAGSVRIVAHEPAAFPDLRSRSPRGHQFRTSGWFTPVHKTIVQFRSRQGFECPRNAHSRAADRIAGHSVEMQRRRNFSLAKLGRHGDFTSHSGELYPARRRPT
jgi:hypothetical protein